MLDPFIINLAAILRSARGVSYTGDLITHVTKDPCMLCEFAKTEWWRTRRKMRFYRERFTTHRGYAVIPYSIAGKTALYLPLDDDGAAVRVEPFDFDNPPADVVYPALPPAARTVPPPAARTVPPPLTTQMKTLATAVYDWTKSGFALATGEQQAARKAICESCEFWKGDGHLGTGKCLKCGCSGVKLKLATSSCPIGKWHAVHNSEGVAGVPATQQPAGPITAGAGTDPAVQPPVPGAPGRLFLISPKRGVRVQGPPGGGDQSQS